LFYVEKNYDWNPFLLATQCMSMFDEQRVLDLRFPDKPDKSSAEVLSRYAAKPAEDCVLLVHLPRLTSKEQNVRWFQAVEAQGVFIQVWPLQGAELLTWLERRLSSRQLSADRAALAILAARVEGNLLAAAQEIDKLQILYGVARIDEEKMRVAIADSARYDIFDLAEAALSGNFTRIHRILTLLRAEAVTPVLSVWALAREIRVFLALKVSVEKGQGEDAAFSSLKERVFDKRKTVLSTALRKLSRENAENALLGCARVDRQIKGQQSGDVWDGLLDVCMRLHGKSLG
jgi:DNA polymerase-3 subunit delta